MPFPQLHLLRDLNAILADGLGFLPHMGRRRKRTRMRVVVLSVSTARAQCTRVLKKHVRAVEEETAI